MKPQPCVTNVAITLRLAVQYMDELGTSASQALNIVGDSPAAREAARHWLSHSEPPDPITREYLLEQAGAWTEHRRKKRAKP